MPYQWRGGSPTAPPSPVARTLPALVFLLLAAAASAVGPWSPITKDGCICSNECTACSFSCFMWTGPAYTCHTINNCGHQGVGFGYLYTYDLCLTASPSPSRAPTPSGTQAVTTTRTPARTATGTSAATVPVSITRSPARTPTKTPQGTPPSSVSKSLPPSPQPTGVRACWCGGC